MKKTRTIGRSDGWFFRRKTFLTMKITLLLIFCSLFQLKADILAQQKVSIQMKEVTLDKVFKEMSRQVKCSFPF